LASTLGHLRVPERAVRPGVACSPVDRNDASRVAGVRSESVGLQDGSRLHLPKEWSHQITDVYKPRAARHADSRIQADSDRDWSSGLLNLVTIEMPYTGPAFSGDHGSSTRASLPIAGGVGYIVCVLPHHCRWWFPTPSWEWSRRPKSARHVFELPVVCVKRIRPEAVLAVRARCGEPQHENERTKEGDKAQ